MDKAFKKYLKSIIILIILIGFPLISWWYLRGGIEFRKDALNAMEIKAEIVPTIYTSQSGFTFPSEDYRVNTLFVVDEHSNLSEIEAYYNQFKNTGEVAVYVYNKQSGPHNDVDFSTNYYVLDSMDTFLSDKNNSGFDIFLIDANSNVRNYYISGEKTSMNELVTHTAVLLPPTEKREIRRRNPREL